MKDFPKMVSQTDLFRYLEDELGYCGCAGGNAALNDLELTLIFAKMHQEMMLDNNEKYDFQCRQQLRDNFEHQIGFNKSPGTVTWFLYMLEHHDLISHGFNILECTITEKGEALLNEITRFGLEDPNG